MIKRSGIKIRERKSSAKGMRAFFRVRESLSFDCGNGLRLDTVIKIHQTILAMAEFDYIKIIL